jgi:hypothetical protein
MGFLTISLLAIIDNTITLAIKPTATFGLNLIKMVIKPHTIADQAFAVASGFNIVL